MSFRKIIATAGRVLRQLRHDPRTVALILLVPVVLTVILRYVYQGNLALFDRLAPMVLGIFPLTVMFVITSVATLRERSSGTLERLMTMPLSKLDFILGYALAFSALALVQAALASGVTLGLLGVTVLGGTLKVLITAVLAGVLGMSTGLFLSAFARTEFQAVQFLPAFILPQLLVCGLFIDRTHMAKWLQWLADITPLTYVVEAMQHITTGSGWSHDLIRSLVIVGCFALGALLLGALTLRRQE